MVSVLLWPLSLIYAGFAMLRRHAYRSGLLKSHRVGVPVIVVGNISVGGTGKTPLVIRLAQLLRQHGYRPGIVSRGYGGESHVWPRHVTATSDPHQVGDEAVVLARGSGCPVVVDPDRVAAARELLNTAKCDVILADDGLQHYRLARDIEIAVVDEQQGFQNGACLPAGPLREPRQRLKQVSYVIHHGSGDSDATTMRLVGEHAVNLTDLCVSCSLIGFRDSTVHAVAGIGNPLRFFSYLRARGIRTVDHPFPDHHVFSAADFAFADTDDLPVLMTEKDAVKCQRFAKASFWYVPVQAQLDSHLENQLLQDLARCAGKAIGKIC